LTRGPLGYLNYDDSVMSGYHATTRYCGFYLTLYNDIEKQLPAPHFVTIITIIAGGNDYDYSVSQLIIPISEPDNAGGSRE
jgi:hypothetical protein